METQLENLDNNPQLKHLLTEHILCEHEENADISDYSLWQEYLWLLNNNQLNQLWEMEQLLTIYETMRIEDEERSREFA
tara:strand:- start:8682 stop:8918 length:237 start_codon:yes stop_codon:yes gene_type:complete